MEKLVPRLRFPGFEGNWEKHTLGDIAKFSKGKGISKADIIEEGETECIRYGELYTHYGETIKEIKSKTNIPAKDLIFSEANDVIIPGSGETQLDIATASCVLKSGVALGGDLNIIKSPTDGVFLSYYLNNNKKMEIAVLAQGNSVVHLYASQLAKLKLNVPIDEEQKKIGEFINSIEERISNLRKKKALLEQYKKGMMEKIFNQEIRFKDEDGKDFKYWEETTLGQLSTISKGQQLNAENLTETGQYPCINGGISPSGYTDKYNSEDAITISEGGNSCGYVNFFTNKFWSGGHCYTLKVVNEKIDDAFLYQLLKYNEKEIMNLRVGSGLPNIQKGAINGFALIFPCSLKEQAKIANFLSAIDDKINLVAVQIEKCEVWKKGLLGEMFV